MDSEDDDEEEGEEEEGDEKTVSTNLLSSPSSSSSVRARGVDAVDSRGFRVALHLRASREARPPDPSPEAERTAWFHANRSACALEDQGYLRLTASTVPVRVAPTTLQKTSNSSCGVSSRHLMSVHSVSLDSNSYEAKFLSFFPSIVQRFGSLIRAAMRANSVNNSIVLRKRSTQGGAQQTTRHNTESIQQAVSAQSVAVEACLAAARAYSSTPASNPAATCAVSAVDLVHGRHCEKSPFILTSTSKLLPNAMPVRCSSYHLVDSIRELAKRELQSFFISGIVSQHCSSLRLICDKILDTTEGMCVWSSWVLVSYIASRPSLRFLLNECGITNVDLAIAQCLLLYGRSELTRRSRMKRVPGKKRRDADSEDEDDVEDMEVDARRINEANSEIICSKRKRTPTCGSNSGSISESLSFWAAVFTVSDPDLDHTHVLKTMLTNSRSEAGRAARVALSTQTEDQSVANHSLLTNMSVGNAIRSSAALTSLVVFKNDACPKIVTWKKRQGSKFVQKWGLLRSEEDAKNILLNACILPPLALRCPSVTISWCQSIVKPVFRTEDSCISGIMEAREYLCHLESQIRQHTSRHGRHPELLHRKVSEMMSNACGTGAETIRMHGTARAFLHFKTRLTLQASQLEIGKKIANQVEEQVKDSEKRTPRVSDVESSIFLQSCSLSIDGHEPYPAPSNTLAVALVASESFRNLFKDRKHNTKSPCRVFCGVQTATESACQDTTDEFDRPGACLTIVDSGIEIDVKPDQHGNLVHPLSGVEQARARPDAYHVPTVVSLCVSGDQPVRAPEVAKRLLSDARLCFSHSSFANGVDRILQARAILLASAIQASYVADVTRAITCGNINSCTAAAKRIQVPDNNLNLYTTLHQVYLVGHAKVARSYRGTAWEGAYGCGYDMGSSGGVGLRASSVASDRRLHGILLTDEEQVNEFTREMGKHLYIPVNDCQYAPIPLHCRGIVPLGMPFVHSYLDDLSSGFEGFRDLESITSATVSSLQCLPLGPFSSRKVPLVSESADPCLVSSCINPDDSYHFAGKGFSPDCTLEEWSIDREPLFKPPSLVVPEENPFALLHDFLTTFLNAAVVLCEIGNAVCGHEDIPSEKKVEGLFSLLDLFHYSVSKEDEELPCLVEGAFLWASTASVMLNTMFPLQFSIAEPVLLEAYRRSDAECLKAMQEQVRTHARPVGIQLSRMNIDPFEFQKVVQFWSAFSRSDPETSAWSAISPLLVHLMDLNGSMNVHLSTMDAISASLNRAVAHGTWLVHSEDGHRKPGEWSPLHTAIRPQMVKAFHLEPIFAARDTPGQEKVPQRGAAFGVKPCGFHQICSLLLGLKNDEVSVQYYRNEGGVSHLRASGLPDILTRKGKPRSDKAISPVSVEGDQKAFGSRKAKVESTAAQRFAYKRNLDLVFPLCCAISRPAPEDVRVRGDVEASTYVEKRLNECRKNNQAVAESIEAEEIFNKAASSAFQSYTEQ